MHILSSPLRNTRLHETFASWEFALRIHELKISEVRVAVSIWTQISVPRDPTRSRHFRAQNAANRLNRRHRCDCIKSQCTSTLSNNTIGGRLPRHFRTRELTTLKPDLPPRSDTRRIGPENAADIIAEIYRNPLVCIHCERIRDTHTHTCTRSRAIQVGIIVAQEG